MGDQKRIKGMKKTNTKEDKIVPAQPGGSAAYILLTGQIRGFFSADIKWGGGGGS